MSSVNEWSQQQQGRQCGTARDRDTNAAANTIRLGYQPLAEEFSSFPCLAWQLQAEGMKDLKHEHTHKKCRQPELCNRSAAELSLAKCIITLCLNMQTKAGGHCNPKEKCMTKENQQEDRHYMNEPDIGSGEKTPAQIDIEREQSKINVPKQPTPQPPPVGKPQDGSSLAHQVIEEQQHANQHESPGREPGPAPGRILQNGDHLARIVAVQQPDATFEAQVYVRLTREPEVAETFIPVGMYGTEAEAWRAAEQRADRAFTEREF